MAQMTISMRQKHSQILYREQTCGCQRDEGRGKDWEVGISRCKLLSI